MMSKCAFGCGGIDDLDRNASSVTRIVQFQIKEASVWNDIPQRLQRVWVLLCLFPKEEVPFVILGYFGLDSVIVSTGITIGVTQTIWIGPAD